MYLEKRNELLGKIHATLDAKRAAGQWLTDDEQQQIDRMFAEVEQLNKMAANEERAARLKAIVEQQQEEERRLPAALSGAPDQPVRLTQRQAFVEYIRRGDRGLAPEQRALLSGSGGGSYTVPVELFDQIISALGALVPMRSLARVITTAAKTDVPIISAKPTAAYVAENGTVTPSDPTIGQKNLRAKKLVTVCQVSEELLEDSAFDVEREVVTQISMAFAEAEDAAFVNGNGTSEPAGVVAAVTAGVTASGQTALTADNLIDLYFSLPAQYRPNAVFLMRSSTLAYIAKLKDSQNRHLWLPPFGTGSFSTLLGARIVLDESVPAIGATNRSIIFFDPRFYLIADRRDMTVQRLEELYMANGLKAFRAVKRNDGVMTLADAGRALVHPA